MVTCVVELIKATGKLTIIMIIFSLVRKQKSYQQLTNACFAATEFHAMRTDASCTERRLHAVVTATEVGISTLLIICNEHNHRTYTFSSH